MTMTPQPYDRHRLTEEQLQTCLKTARTMATTMGRMPLMSALAGILAENASLVSEVNAHRATLGLEPLQKYDPKFKG